MYLPRKLWEAANDLFLNIHTRSFSESWRGRAVPSLYPDNTGYFSPDYLHLRRVVRRLDLRPADVVYDLGCGAGRFLCLAAQCKVSLCVGVEIEQHLCEKARVNVARLRGRRSPIVIRHRDCAAADVSDGTVYYLYNPFGADTMRAFLGNLLRSLIDRPRSIRIVYFNAVHIHMMTAFHVYDSFYTRRGTHVAFLTNELQTGRLREHHGIRRDAPS